MKINRNNSYLIGNTFAKGNKSNKTSFKKGIIPWNKGVPASKETRMKISQKQKGNHNSTETEFKKGMAPWNKGTRGIIKANIGTFTSNRTRGEKNNEWKGDDVGYYALHAWLYRNFGRPKNCEFCNSTKRVQWASKNYRYSRDEKDWLKLCYRCHREYDSKNGWGKATQKFNL